MSTAVAPRPRLRLRAPAIPEVSPRRRRVLAVLAFALLVAVSAFLRSRALGTSFWIDEGLSVGIASHPFASIPGVLAQDGSPPLYYMMLNVWMSVFGTSESATHALSLLAALLCIPVGFWSARSIFGVRAGWVAAFLCALNPFLTAYGQETRMYALLGLEGLIASTLLVHVFVLRQRRWQLPALPITLAALLYTHGWGIFFDAGAVVVVLYLIFRVAPEEERRELIRDGLIAFGGAAILFLPWVPTVLQQAGKTAAPWAKSPRFGAPIQISRGLMGGDRSAIVLLLVGGAGIAGILGRRILTGPRERPAALFLLASATATLAIAWLVSQIQPAWTTRYFGVVLGALTVLAAAGIARTGRLGLCALLAITFFWANPKQFAGYQKSDLQDIAVDLQRAHAMKPGDIVISAQPEQVPALAYYFGPEARYASPDRRGTWKDPYVMDWREALKRMQRTPSAPAVADLVASLRPGQRVLLVRPFTEGKDNWEAPWTRLVRRRSAQWGQLLASDPSLRKVGTAPGIYRGATTVGNSAVLYRKLG